MDMKHSWSRVAGTALVAASTFFAFGAAPTSAQWSVEGRLGATLPTGDLTEGSFAQTGGLAVGADLMYTFRPNVTFYGGFGHHRFNCDGCDANLTTTGLDAGLKYLFGPADDAIPWIRGGILFHKPEIEGGEGDWGLGFDSGIGIDWRVSHQVVLVPALRYNSYSSNDLTLSWFTIDLGLHLHFGG